MKPALVQVYTGDGKGKSTAACGLALRAAAHGLKVGFFQFFKPATGESLLLKSVNNIRVYHPVTRHPAFQHNARRWKEQFQRNFLRQWKKVKRIINTERFDLVVLDEILIAVRDGFLPEEQLLEFLETRPAGCEVVLTGRKLSRSLATRAALITEMKAKKHPFPAVKARRGIEF
ncbi:MAG TPA: cob(I)yrinic acid a,c-diamide adenosyltransferase [bacterium]|nr:cob(I)yrinic acid a,c-diamide adenosyltransferase [bacterium]HPP12092.1 cob(I)yrinic acid a,c-diamide adenosyltransferase [bacterium]